MPMRRTAIVLLLLLLLTVDSAVVVDASLQHCSLEEWSACVYNIPAGGAADLLLDSSAAFLQCLSRATYAACSDLRGFCGANGDQMKRLAAVLRCLRDPSETSAACRAAPSPAVTADSECAAYFGPLLGCSASDDLCAKEFSAAFSGYFPQPLNSTVGFGSSNDIAVPSAASSAAVALTVEQIVADPGKYLLYADAEQRALSAVPTLAAAPVLYNILAVVALLVAVVVIPWIVMRCYQRCCGNRSGGFAAPRHFTIERAVERTLAVVRSGSLVDIHDWHEELRAATCESPIVAASCMAVLYSVYRYVCFTPDALKQYLPRQQQLHAEEQERIRLVREMTESGVLESSTSKIFTMTLSGAAASSSGDRGGLLGRVASLQPYLMSPAASINLMLPQQAGGAASMRRVSSIFGPPLAAAPARAPPSLLHALTPVQMQQLFSVTALVVSFDVPISALAAAATLSGADPLAGVGGGSDSNSSASSMANGMGASVSNSFAADSHSNQQSMQHQSHLLDSSATNHPADASTTSYGGIAAEVSGAGGGGGASGFMGNAQQDPRGVHVDPFDVDASVPLQPFYELVVDTVRQCVEEHGGTLEHFLGDCLLASFNNAVAAVSRSAAPASDAKSRLSADDAASPLLGDVDHALHAAQCATSLVRRLRAVAAPAGAVVIGVATARGSSLLCGGGTASDDTVAGSGGGGGAGASFSSAAAAAAAAAASSSASAAAASFCRRCVTTGPAFRLAAGLCRLGTHFIFHPDDNRQHVAFMPRYADPRFLNAFAFSDWCAARAGCRVVNQFRERLLGKLVTGDGEATACSHFVQPVSEVLADLVHHSADEDDEDPFAPRGHRTDATGPLLLAAVTAAAAAAESDSDGDEAQRAQRREEQALADRQRQERDEILNAVLAIRIAQVAAQHHRHERRRRRRDKMLMGGGAGNAGPSSSNIVLAALARGKEHSALPRSNSAQARAAALGGGGGVAELGDALAPTIRRRDRHHHHRVVPGEEGAQAPLGAAQRRRNSVEDDDAEDAFAGASRYKADGGADGGGNNGGGDSVAHSIVLDRPFGEDPTVVARQVLSPVQLQRIAVAERRRRRLLQVAATDTLHAAGAVESNERLQRRLRRAAETVRQGRRAASAPINSTTMSPTAQQQQDGGDEDEDDEGQPWQQLLADREMPQLSHADSMMWTSPRQWLQSIETRNAVLNAVLNSIDPNSLARLDNVQSVSSGSSSDDDDDLGPAAVAAAANRLLTQSSSPNQASAPLSDDDDGRTASSSPPPPRSLKRRDTREFSDASKFGAASGKRGSPHAPVFDRERWGALLQASTHLSAVERDELGLAVRDVQLPMYSEAL